MRNKLKYSILLFQETALKKAQTGHIVYLLEESLHFEPESLFFFCSYLFHITNFLSRYFNMKEAVFLLGNAARCCLLL